MSYAEAKDQCYHEIDKTRPAAHCITAPVQTDKTNVAERLHFQFHSTPSSESSGSIDQVILKGRIQQDECNYRVNQPDDGPDIKTSTQFGSEHDTGDNTADNR